MPLTDNPVWAALNGEHASRALRDGPACRYPADELPFFAIAAGAADAGDALKRLIAPGETMYTLGRLPSFGPDWQVLGQGTVLQMAVNALTPAPKARAAIVELTEDDVPEMLSLAVRVMPRFYRARTHTLGRYLGIREQGRLVAIAGERMAFHGHREISGVCTDAAFTGRGHATALVARLASDLLARGIRPWLGVDEANERARAIYTRLGFVVIAELPTIAAVRTA